MDNNIIKKGFLRQLEKQGPLEGWRISWTDAKNGQPRSFFSQDNVFAARIVARLMKDKVAITIEPYAITFESPIDAGDKEK